ncbi:MAG: biotin/lipoyl-containing protein, partial [Chloroflexota bacterium]
MAVDIRVPQLGESVVEATVARWLKNEGDAVAAGDAVVELETEKVNVEVPADAGGVLTQITHREGETVRVGEVLGTLDGQGEGQGPQVRGQRAAPPGAAVAEAGTAYQSAAAPPQGPAARSSERAAAPPLAP